MKIFQVQKSVTIFDFMIFLRYVCSRITAAAPSYSGNIENVKNLTMGLDGVHFRWCGFAKM